MKPVYIVFERYDDVFCEKQHESPYKQGKDGKPKNYRCNERVRCSRVVRFVTTDKELAVRFSKSKPTWGYQEEVLWTSL